MIITGGATDLQPEILGGVQEWRGTRWGGQGRMEKEKDIKRGKKRMGELRGTLLTQLYIMVFRLLVDQFSMCCSFESFPVAQMPARTLWLPSPSALPGHSRHVLRKSSRYLTGHSPWLLWTSGFGQCSREGRQRLWLHCKQDSGCFSWWMFSSSSAVCHHTSARLSRRDLYRPWEAGVLWD